jgi:hypothetical protein
MGLQVESLEPDEIIQITEMMERYEKPSYEDISVLVLARLRKTVLITGDEALRHAAIANEVECRGTCWLIDYLANQSIFPFPKPLKRMNEYKENHDILHGMNAGVFDLSG